MSPLRKQMQDAMVLRRFAARTQKSYIAAVVAIAKVYRRAGRADSGRSRALPAAADRRTQAAPAERKRWRLIGRGLGIHWEDFDEDISVELASVAPLPTDTDTSSGAHACRFVSA